MRTEDVYGAFVDYFGNLLFAITKQDSAWTVYACKISSGLNLYRYIFVIVQTSNALKQEEYLNDLDWVSFQTRTSDELYSVPTHSLIKSVEKQAMLKDYCKVVDRVRDRTNYNTATLPIKLYLQHDPKKKNILQYPDDLYLHQALDTFMCIVEIL